MLNATGVLEEIKKSLKIEESAKQNKKKESKSILESNFVKQIMDSNDKTKLGKRIRILTKSTKG